MSKKLKYQIDESIKVLKTHIKEVEAVEKYSGELNDRAIMKSPYASMEPGGLPPAGAGLLSRVYCKCRADGGSKDFSARTAWKAVYNAGYKSFSVTNILKALYSVIRKAIFEEEPAVEIEEIPEKERKFSILESPVGKAWQHVDGTWWDNVNGKVVPIKAPGSGGKPKGGGEKDKPKSGETSNAPTKPSGSPAPKDEKKPDIENPWRGEGGEKDPAFENHYKNIMSTGEMEPKDATLLLNEINGDYSKENVKAVLEQFSDLGILDEPSSAKIYSKIFNTKPKPSKEPSGAKPKESSPEKPTENKSNLGKTVRITATDSYDALDRVGISDGAKAEIMTEFHPMRGAEEELSMGNAMDILGHYVDEGVVSIHQMTEFLTNVYGELPTSLHDAIEHHHGANPRSEEESSLSYWTDLAGEKKK